MKKKNLEGKRIFETTRQHISRNSWLSVATISVVMITFTIATIFVGLLTVSSRTIAYFSKSAQLIIFFKPNTEKDQIEKVKETFTESGLLESIKYISEGQAVQIYKDFYRDYPTLTETVTEDDVFPSLELRGKDVNKMPQIKELAEIVAKENPTIDSIMYFKDLVQKLKGFSSVITFGGGILLAALASMSIMLILITIGFNINAHKHEIEVMHLIGSTDSYIRTPFLLEGMFYSMTGAAISTILLLIIWYGSVALLRGNELFLFISPILDSIDMSYLSSFNPVFVILLLLSQTLIGGIIGYISSSAALWRYLR